MNSKSFFIDNKIDQLEEIEKSDIYSLTERFSITLIKLINFADNNDENLPTTLIDRISFINRTAIWMSEALPAKITKLSESQIITLGDLEFRGLRSCIRALAFLKEKNLTTQKNKWSRFKEEFNLIENICTEILAFIETVDNKKDEDKTDTNTTNESVETDPDLSNIMMELRLAKEMYSHLIGRVDEIRNYAIDEINNSKDKITLAREAAISDSETIKELVSKSTNAYLAADFSERKKGNTLELAFWFSIMTALFSIDGWLIANFDISAKDIWQNRLIDLGLIGFIATIAFWMGRNFRAAMHQRTILDQRIATLKTFQAFYEKVENQSLKDSIVLEASRTIFSHASSGYSFEGSQNELPNFSDIAKISSITNKS